MAIHPVYAEAILDGTKKVEFRKRRLAEDIRTVWIYATAPVQRIVGEFHIGETVVDSPETIWSSFGAVGIIEHSEYQSYFAEKTEAVAFVVQGATRYETPVALHELEPRPSIPQSFSYRHA
ncbi:ASCH domain-containing protein [Frigoribacterium sp. UYMn621]|jgi:predicted transcriptional regulator|uniref:ASCH domain-containing protein n=1 Tax=Frigoribacterium sp. UYMn621 TaxID=3156343 RepID=UPI0033938183